MIIKVKVKPKSSREEVKKTGENMYEVKVKETPQGGKANKRLVELLSQYFKVPKSRIKIKKGLTVKNKIVEILE